MSDTYVSYFDGEEKHSPSPFLPGTKVQFAWDSISLSWLKTCPRLYQYSMIEGWRAKGTGVHLKFGKLYHSALEFYDKLRLPRPDDPHGHWGPDAYDHDNALREVVLQVLHDTWDYDKCHACEDGRARDTGYICLTCKGSGKMNGHSWASDHPAKNRETLIRSVIWYLDHFKDDPAATLILANGKPAVELSFRMELDWGPKAATTYKNGYAVDLGQPYILSGHLDRVVEFGGQKYVMDRKTTGSSPTPHYFDGFAPDNQMSIYTLAARVQFSTPVAGVIIDAAQIAVGFTRFQRGFTYRTETQLEEFLTDAHYWFAQAEGFAQAGYWPMNDRACGMYGGCTFRKVCSKSPEVRERFLESDFERKPWNPLQNRG